MDKTKNSVNMLEGPIVGPMLKFAVPMALIALLQMTFNSADMAVVGRFVGPVALAAVGANASVINLMIGLFIGIAVGANSVVARAIGQKDDKFLSEAIHTSVVLGLIFGIFLLVLGTSLVKPIHVIMETPDDVIGAAELYLRIYFCGVPFVILYNFESGVLRAKGDTRRPLIVISCAGVVNVVLNIFFVKNMGMGVEGVALATAISNALSSGTLFILLMREEGAFKLKIRKLRIHWNALKDIISIGGPSGLNGVVFNLSNVVIQHAVNTLGSTVMAAFTAAGNFESYIYYIFNAFGLACLSYVSQNFGAKNINRARQSVNRTFIVGLGVTLVLSAFVMLFKVPLLHIFTKDDAVIEVAIRKMNLSIVFQFLNYIMNFFPFATRGYGNSIPPSIVSLCGACAFRLVWVYTIFAMNPTFMCLYLVYPVSWTLTGIIQFILYKRTEKKYEEQFADGEAEVAESVSVE